MRIVSLWRSSPRVRVCRSAGAASRTTDSGSVRGNAVNPSRGAPWRGVHAAHGSANRPGTGRPGAIGGALSRVAASRKLAPATRSALRELRAPMRASDIEREGLSLSGSRSRTRARHGRRATEPPGMGSRRVRGRLPGRLGSTREQIAHAGMGGPMRRDPATRERDQPLAASEAGAAIR